MIKGYEKKLRERLKQIRKLKHLTQEQAAEKSNGAFSRNILSNWERGETVIPASAVPDICKIYELTPNQLLGWPKDEQDTADMAINDIRKINDYVADVVSKYEQPAYEDNILIAASGAEDFDEDEMKLLREDVEMVRHLGEDDS